MNSLITYALLFCLGFISKLILDEFFNNLKEKNRIKDINDQFSELLNNIISNNSKFKSRVNNIVYIDTKLKDYNEVSVVYLMDKKDVAIFKNGKCIYLSEMAEKEIINSLISAIDNKYGNEINDVIEILGIIFSRKDFEETFKMKIEDLYNPNTKLKISEESDIDKIIKENNSKFDIDEILDKISKFGMDSLTNDEKYFLKKYKG